VRAIVRDRSHAAALEQVGVEIAPGDLTHPDSYRDALRGVDQAFILSPAGPSQLEMEIAFIDAAKAAGSSLIVKHSAVGADPNGSGFGATHGRVEKHLEESGVPYAIVRPTPFMQNLLHWLPSIARAHALVIPLVDESVHVNLVDVDDIVEVEAAVLTEEGRSGRVYTVAGPELLTYAEIAERLSRGAGAPIPLEVPAAERFRQEALAAGYEPGSVDGVVSYYSTLRTGHTALAVSEGDVAAVTGHAPRSLAEFAHRHAAAFLGA
jgi:uncharacterized protein YbjT (DUF2867 family)